jgi:hypothetical protein
MKGNLKDLARANRLAIEQDLKKGYSIGARNAPGQAAVRETLTEAVDNRAITIDDLSSIAQLWEETVLDEHGEPIGRTLLNDMRAGRPAAQLLHESNGAVTTQFFNDIMGQISFSVIRDGYEMPGLNIADICTIEPRTGTYGEAMPQITGTGDMAEAVGENQEYPKVTIGRSLVHVPDSMKYGFDMDITEEVLLNDKTGQVKKAMTQAAEYLGINLYKSVLDVVLGITTSYRRNNGAAQATYADSHTEGTFDNLIASNALVDWTDIEAAELLFDAMTDPETGEPIIVTPTTIIVPTALKMTARRVLNATEIEHVDNQTNAATIRTKSANPLTGYNIVSNQYVKARTSSASTWFIGDFKKAFAYFETKPLQVWTRGAESDAYWSRDVIAQTKVRRWGVPAVVEPRYVVKSTA